MNCPVQPKRIYLSSPHMGAEELGLVQEAFASNWIAPLGPHVDAFERELADFVQMPHAAALSSGTAALHLALRILGLQPDDDVVCSTLTFSASANPILYERAALHASTDAPTKFMAVRFGDVLGSSGSVVPTFSRQIAAGGPVKVTHPEVTRYFMTIPEATRLVLQSAAQGEGGEIFVLDMGNPIKIVDLARQMIELNGLVPERDIEITFTGLRPGEKLYEELSHVGENLRPTDHPKVMRYVSEPLSFTFMQTAIDEFVRCINTAEAWQVKEMLKALIPEYRPFGLEDDEPGTGAVSHVDQQLAALPELSEVIIGR